VCAWFNLLVGMDESEEAEKLRFQMELEFVQCLANPSYLNCASFLLTPSYRASRSMCCYVHISLPFSLCVSCDFPARSCEFVRLTSLYVLLCMRMLVLCVCVCVCVCVRVRFFACVVRLCCMCVPRPLHGALF